MEEDIIRKYQETLALLQFRSPSTTFYGNFDIDDDGRYAFVLTVIKKGSASKKKYKYMKNANEALRYFIRVSQNRFF